MEDRFGQLPRPSDSPGPDLFDHRPGVSQALGVCRPQLVALGPQSDALGIAIFHLCSLRVGTPRSRCGRAALETRLRGGSEFIIFIQPFTPTIYSNHLMDGWYRDGVADPVRVMLEQGKKKRVVACAFEWPGWDRSAKIGEDVLAVLAAYRPRYAKVAELAGFGPEFSAAGELQVVERLEGTGMTDYYGVSARAAAPENEPMTEAECERKIALLRASWSTFDDVAARVSPELRKGPRGGGRERDQIIRHANGAEIHELATKVGVKVPLETRDDVEALNAYRDAFVEGIREHHARDESARSWALQFLIRRCTWHMLDHAWEMEDRDLTSAPA